jgi:hypothetical protein
MISTGLGARVLVLGQAALESQKYEVGTAANAEFAQQVGNVKFNGAFGDVQATANLLVGEVLKQ